MPPTKHVRRARLLGCRFVDGSASGRRPRRAQVGALPFVAALGSVQETTGGARAEPTGGAGWMPGLDLNSLLSGAVGGVGVLLLTILYDRIKAALDRRRERRGLLLLMDAEVYSHIVGLRNAGTSRAEGPEEVEALNSLSVPRMDNWDSCKERLAQLLPPDHVKDLVIYYKALRDIVDITSFDLTKSYRARILAALAPPLMAQANAIRSKGERYLKELPNYSEPGFDPPLPSQAGRPNASAGQREGRPPDKTGADEAEPE